MTPFLDGFFRHLETALMLPFCLITVFIVHELGHYIAARLMGLRVESVTFGRGRQIWSRLDDKKTLWKFHIWPLRAHVQIADFDHSPLSLGRKILVVAAGPLANLLLPCFLFFGFFILLGQPVIPNIVTAVEPQMPAFKAGLRPGDKILSIDGESIASMDDILAHTSPRRSTPLIMRYERGKNVHETSMSPEWTRYRDMDGVMRAHGRIGLSTWQQPYDLSVVRSVASIPTPTMEEARVHLVRHMGERIEVGLWSMDGKIYTSVIDLSPRSNRHLADAGHRESKKIYLGTLRDNIYLPVTAGYAMRESLSRNFEMIGHMARLPFNLFPIDKEWITPDAVVSGETSQIRAKLYVFVFFTSLCSCFIGLLNLIPFPKLDGGEILLMLGEAWKRRPLANTEKARILVFGVLFFYAAVFGANMGDMRSYYFFQMQKSNAAEQK